MPSPRHFLRWTVHPAWDAYSSGDMTAEQLGEAYSSTLSTLLITIYSEGLVTGRGEQYDANNVPQVGMASSLSDCGVEEGRQLGSWTAGQLPPRTLALQPAQLLRHTYFEPGC